MSFAIKVAPKGLDIGSAADYQLTFSSEWPTLKIAATGTFAMAGGATSIQTIYTHNLGYTPLVMVLADTLYGDSGTNFPSGGRGVMTDFRLFIDGTALKYWADGGSPTTAFNGRYFIFAQSVADTIAATSFTTTPASVVSTTNNFKVVISKEGKDITSTDPRDLVVSSDYKSPNIHMASQLTIPDDGGGFGQGIVNHNLGYPPLYLAMLKGDGSYEGAEYWVPFLSSTNGADIEATTTQLQFNDLAGNVYYYVIFKDPFTST